jgi:hypothetical protein
MACAGVGLMDLLPSVPTDGQISQLPADFFSVELRFIAGRSSLQHIINFRGGRLGQRGFMYHRIINMEYHRILQESKPNLKSLKLSFGCHAEKTREP